MLHETRVGAGNEDRQPGDGGAQRSRWESDCLLIAQVGVAGSAKLGDEVVLAGQVGVAGHIEIEDRVQVVSKSAVFKPVEAGRRVAGIPATDSMTWRRQQVRLRRLQQMEDRLARLERKLDADRSD